jgi:cytochrome c peroxidase
VVEYKNAAVPQADIPEEYLDSRFVPLNLTPKEVDELVSFLEGGLYDADLMRYVPETLPSGNCVTNADLLSRSETGCDL